MGLLKIVGMVSKKPFFHRKNADGTIDSICPRCYMTVGTTLNESGLAELEKSHICDPKELAWRRLRITV